jgi:hypothetical protein
MKRFDRAMLRGYASAAVILLAVLAWPSEGWSKTTRHVCNADFVKQLVQSWADELKRSWQQNDPDLVVGKYDATAALLPTCESGPLVGRTAIKGYFLKFLTYKPEVVQLDTPAAGGDCTTPFGSGLYTFKLVKPGSGEVLQASARYTYVFHRVGSTYLIMQHHSSLVPAPGAACP